MENLIIQILSILIQSITATYYCITFSKYATKNSYNKSKIFITFISLFIVIGIITMINLKENHLLLNTIISLISLGLIIKFSLNIKYVKGLLLSILYYVILGITEILSFSILNIVLNFEINLLLSTPKYLFIFLIFQALLNFIIITIINLIFSYRNINSHIFECISMKNIKILILIILGYIIPQFITFTINHYSYSNSLLIINTLQIVLVSVLIFLYFKNIINKEKIEAELIIAETHNKTLIEIVDSVRTLKHDYGNIVQALNGYVLTKQYEQLDEYVNSLLKEFNSVNNVSSIDPKIFNEPAIYGVVGAKYFFATQNDITFELDITTNIKGINFSKPELSRILGILLDNAIEATQKTKEKYIRLEMHYNEKKYADIIRIINTYDSSINIDLDNIFEKGVSSKKIKSGIGLWEVKKLIKKNKYSQIYAAIENDKFVQNLIIEKAE